ncbi:MAG: hypothetical protein RCO49_08885 [Rickettsia endosymbiont of Argas persicus]
MLNNENSIVKKKELTLTIQNLVKDCNKEYSQPREILYYNYEIPNGDEYNNRNESCDICKCLGDFGNKFFGYFA